MTMIRKQEENAKKDKFFEWKESDCVLLSAIVVKFYEHESSMDGEKNKKVI